MVSALNKIAVAIILLISFLCHNSILLAQGLTFQQVGDSIKVEGTFKKGDTKRFSDFVDKRYRRKKVEKTVILNSRGGSLLEGLMMGQLFRKQSFTTLVKEGDKCYSACAIAFLGGTEQFVTTDDIGRKLEVGSKLGLHGYSFGNKEIVLLNEAFDAARAINGLIIEYASSMKEIDLSLLSKLLTVSPERIILIDTPRRIQGLGIEIKGNLPKLPNSWAFNACKDRIDKMIPIKGPIKRISNQSRFTSIKSKNEFRNLLLDDLYSTENAVQSDIENLSTELFFDTIVRINPSMFPARRISLSRGAGFYYDYCYAVRDHSQIHTLIINKLGGNYPELKSHSKLIGYPKNKPLW